MSLIGKTISGVALAGAIGLAAAANAAAPSPTPRPPAAAATPPAATAKPPTTAPSLQAPATTAKPPATAPSLQPPTAAATPGKPPTAVIPTLPSTAATKPAAPAEPPGPALPDVSEARLALAKQVMKVAPSIGDFNGILPDLMQDTKSRLINGRPDLYKQISVIVETTASSLVPRRNDLDSDVARVWARSFTDDELKVIQAFFSSPTGQKYRAIAPQVGTDIVKAGQNWADRVAGEMYDKSLAELQKQIK